MSRKPQELKSERDELHMLQAAPEGRARIGAHADGVATFAVYLNKWVIDQDYLEVPAQMTAGDARAEIGLPPSWSREIQPFEGENT